jgi:hypothetical protein
MVFLRLTYQEVLEGDRAALQERVRAAAEAARAKLPPPAERPARLYR